MCVWSVMQSRAMRTSAMRGAAALIASAVIAVGCSGGDSLPPVEEPVGASDESEQPVPAQQGDEAGPSAQPERSEPGEPSDPAAEIGQEPPLAGLYTTDFEAGAMTALAIGILEIEPPCVYLYWLDDTDGRTTRMPDGNLQRYLVRLPRAFVRFDSDTGEIWIRDEGPMTSGDDVSLGGGGEGGSYVRLTVEGECSAHGIWHASSMTAGLDHMLPFGWGDPPAEPRELTNTFEWDPTGGFGDTSVSGTLEIAPACAYVTDEIWVRCVAIEPDLKSEPRCVYVTGTGTDGGEAAVTAEGAPVRTLVRLPLPLTSYDPDSGELWVAGHGPMTSGDAVTVIGSVGWAAGDTPVEEPFEGGCAAHGSLWAASMQPTGPEPGEAIEAGETVPPLAGMFPWDPKQRLPRHALAGTLVIEAPCVYVDVGPEWRTDSWYRPDHGHFRMFVRLPQPLVRFDAGSGALWLGKEGPFVTGDYLDFSGGRAVFFPDFDSLADYPDKREYDGGCSAHDEFWAMSIR